MPWPPTGWRAPSPSWWRPPGSSSRSSLPIQSSYRSWRDLRAFLWTMCLENAPSVVIECYGRERQNPPLPLGVPSPVGPSQPVVALHIAPAQLPLLPLVTSKKLLVWLYSELALPPTGPALLAGP